MRPACVFSLFLCCALHTLRAQVILDPCLTSIEEAGHFYGSENLRNLTCCFDAAAGSDLWEWDGEQWFGGFSNSEVSLPPPPGTCTYRAIWAGSNNWTFGGEGIAFRLSSPLENGKQYTFKFTYASDGFDANGAFAPIVYTEDNDINLRTANRLGTLPPTHGFGWTTSDFSFTATSKENGHTWLLLHAYESSGFILGDCYRDLLNFTNPLPVDTLLCENTMLTLTPPSDYRLSYLWHNGSTAPSLELTEPGDYSLQLDYGTCSTTWVGRMDWYDCEVRLDLPNVITPNDDGLNDSFEPIAINHIERAQLQVYNRWGNVVYTGNFFNGWQGQEVAAGVYFYQVDYIDKNGNSGQVKGLLTVVKD